jgi:cobalt-zinc-cadmium efflux system outer membrane protein
MRACLAVLVFIATGASLTAQQLTEQEAVKRFMEQSPAARALTAQVEIVRAETRAATLIPNPAVFVSRESSGGTVDQFVTAEQTLPVSGRLGLLRRAGGAAIDASRSQIRWELLQLRSELRAAFYDVLAGQRRVAAVETGVNNLKEVVRILGERERAGEGSGYDTLRSDRELADLESELVNVRASLTQARAQLAAFLGKDATSDALTVTGDFAYPEPLPALDQVLQRALQNRGDLVAQQHQATRFDFERRAAERLRIPEPAIAAGLKKTTTALFTDNGYVASVTVPLPLFNRGQADAARARAQRERVEAQGLALKQQIEAEVKASYAVYQMRAQLASEYTHGLGTKGAELSRIAQLSYEEGERGILELLDANQVALASQLRAIELQSAAKKAQIELDRAVGEEVLREEVYCHNFMFRCSARLQCERLEAFRWNGCAEALSNALVG